MILAQNPVVSQGTCYNYNCKLNQMHLGSLTIIVLQDESSNFFQTNLHSIPKSSRV